MIRTFSTHRVRKQRELTGSIWYFSPMSECEHSNKKVSTFGKDKEKRYPVVTPCCWENLPGFGNYRGEGEYTTTFFAEGTIRLEFKGVSHTATVFLDGEKIADHYNAYTAFDAVVRGLEVGMHTLTVRADNRFSEDSALHIPNDYMSYGGVSRPVVAEQIDDLYIRSVHVTPFREEEEGREIWYAKVEVVLKNIGDCDIRADVSAKLAGRELVWEKVIVSGGEEFVLRKTEKFGENTDRSDCGENIRTWTPEHPNLYSVEISVIRGGIVTDDLIDRFGFREVEVKGKDILLNGEKIRIRGLCRHEDHPQFGCALPYEAMAADLQIIQDLGANSVRTAHYPNDERFLDLCDELGILVWEENHARGLSEEDMGNPNFELQAERVIEEMITAHYNHPSIYIWGILNECASDSEYGKECYEKQFALIRRLDNSRPCSFASCKFKTDICFGLPDVVSYNIYPLWYHDTPVAEYLDDLYQWIQSETEGKDKPFLVTEIGAGGLYGYRNPYHSKWTEEYQAEALEQQISAVMNYENCSGVYIWQFCDIRVSEEWFGGRPRTMNNKGVVDEYRRPKLCYDVVKRLFKE